MQSSSAVIYGVITEPGHHTTVMSLYGQTTNRQWRVFTIDFRAVFERECRDSDYILWMPWDLVGLHSVCACVCPLLDVVHIYTYEFTV